jgi:hypothetical protein
MIEAVVVADRGERGSIGRERNRRERRALGFVTADELGGDMLRVGGAAAVAAQEHLAAL